jgi:formate-dependent nitrite reductase membrane component NrfD
VLLRPLAAPAPDPLRPGDARVDYDTPHLKPWGLDMAVYLLTKGIATGTMLVSLLLPVLSGARSSLTVLAGPAISLLFLLITAIVLIVDLERPARFYYILVRPNWRSWMVWGAYFLTAQGLLSTIWLAAALARHDGLLALLIWPLAIASILTTCYTGLLFAQGLARDLWQGPQSTIDLLAQAIVEGAAVLLLASAVPGVESDAGIVPALGTTLVVALLVHLAIVSTEQLVMPSPTRHHELAVAAIRRGAFARTFWIAAIGVPVVAGVVAIAGRGLRTPLPLLFAALLALAGSFAWEYIWVEAGQSVPLS